MTFGAPGWFWALLAIPILIGLFIRAERRGLKRLREFASPRLLAQLAGGIDRSRRVVRFGLQLVGLSCGILALAQPRWGYTFQDVQRKGLDLLIAIDTSRSMLSNDVQPNRLQRVKLAAQDLIDQSQGDRVGLIAFAGRAFLQAPLTIDYDAAVESINDLDTKTIPEGGTNISEAISLATQTFGKTATGNRALILFTDGEELSGDATKVAKQAADSGVRIFTIGVGTPEGSLIPIGDDGGGISFVKDPNGQVVKSKLDEKRLREIAEATGGAYFHLASGPATMRQLFSEGVGKMKAAEMDVRLSRRPIERYHWPLAAGLVGLVASLLLGERKRTRVLSTAVSPARVAAPATAIAALMLSTVAQGAVPGVDLYQAGKYPDAYGTFEQDLKTHPNASVRDKIQFDAGASAYKMGDYNKALEAFSGSLLSRNQGLQENSHYNIGRTLEGRADMDKSDDESLKDLEDAESHYEQALKLKPDDEDAKANLEEVKKKIERLKKKPKPTPTPPPRSKQQKKDDQQKDSGDKNQQNKSSQQNQDNQKNDQQQQQSQSQSQGQNQSAQNQKPDQQQNQSLAKNEQQPNPQPQAGQSPPPSPNSSAGKDEKQEPGRQSSGAQNEPEQTPTPTPGDEMPSPSPGEGEQTEPSATPQQSATPKPGGEIKGASGDQPNKPENAKVPQAQEDSEGQMTEQQAEELLRSTKDEEARVQLDERRVSRHVYKDW